MEIKNIIFDLGDVLVGLDMPRCVEAFEKIGAKKAAEFIKDGRTQDLFYEAEIGEISQWEFCDGIRQLSGCEARNEDIIWAWNQLLVSIPEKKKQQLIELKRKGFRLFLLSNTNYIHWQYCAEELFPYKHYIAEDFFEHIYLSFEMHKAKPNTNIFTQVLADAGIEPEETLFIDDNKDNCEAAEKLGIITFQNTEPDLWLQIFNND